MSRPLDLHPGADDDTPADGDMGAIAVGIVSDGIKAVVEKREPFAVHRKVAPELVVRESTRNIR